MQVSILKTLNLSNDFRFKERGAVKVYLKNFLKILFMECVSMFHNSPLAIYLGSETLELLSKMISKQASLSFFLLHVFKH